MKLVSAEMALDHMPPELVALESWVSPLCNENLKAFCLMSLSIYKRHPHDCLSPIAEVIDDLPNTLACMFNKSKVGEIKARVLH